MEFINAQEMAKNHPHTFHAPSKKELAGIAEKDIVKISHNQERFWVIVTNIKGNIITGTVDNELINEHDFSYGNSIQFNKDNIYNINS